MAWMQVRFYSDILRMPVRCNVFLPHAGMNAPSKPPRPVLWLLHGAFGSEDDWLRRTAAERYAQSLGLSVVMPSAQLSAYMDMAHGGAYRSFIMDELIPKMRAMLPLSRRREDNFIAGLSMGGFGALMLGLYEAEMFSAVGCFSAGIDLMRGVLDERLLLADWAEHPYLDVRGSAEAIARGEKPPVRVYLSCGTEDSLLSDARAARDFFTALPGNSLHFHYEESSGAHSWLFWDEHLRRFLDFLNLPEQPGMR